MPFMSEAVLYAIQSNQTYKQTGIDDLESVVWVLLWFFFHYTPHDVGDGWEPVQYQDDVASRPSMSAEPATPRMKLLPSVLSPGPAAGSTPRKRSPVDSGSSRKRARSNIPRDPLTDFFCSYSSAQNMKGFLKLSGSFPPHLHRGWNSIAVARLFVEIWSLEGWQALLPRIPGFSPIDMRLPGNTTEKERISRFSELVQKLKGIFQLAAQQATEYYPDTGKSDQ